MIESLDLKNFTVFKDLHIEFSPKINVIIGENGTGKTHLLKAAYAISGRGYGVKVGEPKLEQTDVAFMRLFMPLEGKLGKLHKQGATSQAIIKSSFPRTGEIAITFFNNSKLFSMNYKNLAMPLPEATFIPTKEILSFMEGFASLYDKYSLSFDQTYRDICLLLDLPALRPENLKERSKWSMEEIQKICDGKFIFHGGGKVTFKTNDNNEYSANAVAEGFRKLGMLYRLLETGSVVPGISGPLFWDEPEANLNPKLMKLLVQILLELSRSGQQIILATHDYVLLKWFDLLADKGQGDHVLFHSLYRDQDTAEIKIASTEDYLQITPNPIDEAFGYLIDREIETDMGGLGK